jgi:hypothetical protein
VLPPSRYAASLDLDYPSGACVNNHPKVTPIYQLKFPPLG